MYLKFTYFNYYFLPDNLSAVFYLAEGISIDCGLIIIHLGVFKKNQCIGQDVEPVNPVNAPVTQALLTNYNQEDT